MCKLSLSTLAPSHLPEFCVTVHFSSNILTPNVVRLPCDMSFKSLHCSHRQKYGHIMEALTEKLRAEPDTTSKLINETFSDFLPASQTDALVSHVSSQPIPSQLDFLLRFTPAYHDADPPSTRGVWKIAIVLGLGYFSGLIPLLPYMIVNKHQVEKAL